MNDFVLISLDYHTEVSRGYNKFASLPGFVLLESSDKQGGRFDILSAFPYETMRYYREQVNPNTWFDELEKKLGFSDLGLDLPFQGGGIGYFSYDLGCIDLGIAIDRQKELTDFRLAEIGLYDWAFIIDHQLKKVTLFSANTRQETQKIIEEVLERWRSPINEIKSYIIDKPIESLMSKVDYEESFAAIHRDLERGRCYQVNLTQPFKIPYYGDNWAIYENIKYFNPAPFSAYISLDEGAILSFSPERFILGDKGILLTSPIKGTSHRANDYLEDERLKETLAACPKNHAENIMIVDLLRNDLGKIAKPGEVWVKGLCEVETYKTVHHLVSHIMAKTKADITPLKAFRACFPGGSITGAPKHESMRAICEYEPYRRGIYCGSIGYFSRHGRFDTNIAIRTITATEDQLHLSAGGGIVIDSTCDSEYQECFTKIEGILKYL